MKNVKLLFLTLLSFVALTSCSSDDGENVNKPSTPETPVLVFNGTIEMAHLKSQNADPKCFLNLTTGETYKLSQSAANAKNIDLVWGSRASVPSQKYIASPSDTFVFHTIGGSNDLWQDFDLFAGWNVRNTVKFDLFGKVGFENIVTNAQFDAYIEGESVFTEYLPFEGTQDQLQLTYMFETVHDDIRYIGVFKFTSANPNTRMANYTIKLRAN